MNWDPPGNWREHDARVRKARARRQRLGTLAVVLILAIAAFVFWRQLAQSGGAGAEERSRPAATSPSSRPEMTGPETVEAPRGSDRILTCTANDGSTFYTNASTCAEADLDNRVTVVESRPEAADAAIGQNCVDSSREGRASNRFLAACQEPFSQALALERYLVLAEDPATSVRAAEYCDLIVQGVNAGCMATNAQFCFLRICQQRLERASR